MELRNNYKKLGDYIREIDVRNKELLAGLGQFVKIHPSIIMSYLHILMICLR